jgi:ribosomal protein S21
MSQHNVRQIEAWAHENGVKIKGSKIKVKGRGDERSIAKAIQDFKRFVVREVAKDIRSKEFFESKGTIKRRKRAEQNRRYQKLQREQANED